MSVWYKTFNFKLFALSQLIKKKKKKVFFESKLTLAFCHIFCIKSFFKKKKRKRSFEKYYTNKLLKIV